MVKLTNQTRRWGKKDDEKLHRLVVEGAVDPLDESKENIEDIRSKHFSWCIYKNFRINFGNKVKEFQINNALSGARARGKRFIFVLVVFLLHLL
jgi:hypothetical protein